MESQDITINGKTGVECADLTLNDCSFHDENFHEHQKNIFKLYERYIQKEHISDESDSDYSDVSVDDDQGDVVMENFDKTKTPSKATRLSRRYSNLAELEHDYKKYGLKFDDTIEMDENVELPWNLDEMNEDKILDLISNLADQVERLDSSYVQTYGENMSKNYQGFIQHIKKEYDNMKNDFNEKIAVIKAEKQKNQQKCEEKQNYGEILSELINDIKMNMEKLRESLDQWNIAKELKEEGNLV